MLRGYGFVEILAVNGSWAYVGPREAVAVFRGLATGRQREEPLSRATGRISAAPELKQMCQELFGVRFLAASR